MLVNDLNKLIDIRKKSQDKYKLRKYVLVSYLTKPLIIISILSFVLMTFFFEYNNEIQNYSTLKHVVFSMLSFVPLSSFIAAMTISKKNSFNEEVSSIIGRVWFYFIFSLVALAGVSLYSKLNSVDPASYVPYESVQALIGFVALSIISFFLVSKTQELKIDLNTVGIIESDIYNIEIIERNTVTEIKNNYKQEEIQYALSTFKTDQEYKWLKNLFSN